MTPKNDPITLQLPAHLVDELSKWIRTDAQYMRTEVNHATFHDIRCQRERTAESLVLYIVHTLPDLSVESDLADAINERKEAYAEYDAAQLSKMGSI